MNSQTPIIGVLSGKGGVGKTNVVANVAVAAAEQGARVLAVDGDVGLSSLDVLLGLKTERTVAHVLAGECSWQDVIVDGPGGIHVLPAADARSDLTGLRPRMLARLIVPLLEARHLYDLILLDVGPGISRTVVSLALVCDRLLLVTTPEPTSLADAYAMLKVLDREKSQAEIEIIVNASRDERDARDVHDRLRRVARHFLKIEPSFLSHVSKDPRLEDAVRLQQPVVQAFPTAPSSRQLRRIADGLLAAPTPPLPEARGALHVEN